MHINTLDDYLGLRFSVCHPCEQCIDSVYMYIHVKCTWFRHGERNITGDGGNILMHFTHRMYVCLV